VKQPMWNKKGGAGKGWGGDGGKGDLMNMLAMVLAAKGGKGGCKGWGGSKKQGTIAEIPLDTTPCDPSEVETFLAMHQVEAHAVQKLRDLDPRLQRVVLEKGSMVDARDQTAVLIMRCARALKASPSGWMKGNIDDVAKHAVPCGPAEVEAFLSMHQVQDHAAQKLRELDPRLQRVVLAKGSMSDARDQSAVLIMRCARALRAMPGDWICPACNDLNFSKQVVCRQCGAAKPQALTDGTVA